jgi:hypothetical protein
MAGKFAHDIDELMTILTKYGGDITEASRQSGISRHTFNRRIPAYTRSQIRNGSPVSSEPLPPDDITDEELWQRTASDSKIKLKYAEAERIRKHKLKIIGPFAILWFGDPHLDDPHCNYEKVEEALALAQRNKAVLCANIGDSLNAWVGRLQAQYAHQTVTVSQALRLYKKFLNSVNWWLWLFGNHCLWDTGTGAMMKHLAAESPATALSEWDIKVDLELPNGRHLKINAAHNFKGNSKYNILHGLQVEALESGAEHDILVAGHHHNFGFACHEHPRNGRYYTLIRARGFKHNGQYERVNGFHDYKNGHCVMTVIDPDGSDAGFVTTFSDILKGESFLNHLRNEWQKKGKKK